MSDMTTSAALGRGVEAWLAGQGSGPGQTFDPSAVLKEAARAGWLDAFNLGVRGTDGLTVEDAVVVCETFGRQIAPVSLLVAAGFVKPLLTELGASPLVAQVESWLEDGAAVAVPTPRLRLDPDSEAGASYTLDCELRVDEAAGGMRLSGSIERITDAGARGLIASVGGLLLGIPLGSPGVTMTSSPTILPGHEVGRVELDGFLVDPDLVVQDGVEGAVDRAATMWSLAQDGYAVGICRELVSGTVQFVLDREQFGQPVGGFQAVQHLAADMHIAAETSASAVHAAATRWSDAPEAAREQVVASRLHSAAAAVTACETAIQLHGGIGFTWEMGIHEWYRAAQFAQRYLTEEAELRAFLAWRLGCAERAVRGSRS